MENEKKSSRFGVRLSSVIVTVLLVVCMAVPAFAAELPDGVDPPPFDYYFVYQDGNQYHAVDLSGVSVLRRSEVTSSWSAYNDNDEMITGLRFALHDANPTSTKFYWIVQGGQVSRVNSSFPGLYSNVPIRSQGDLEIVFGAPDFTGSVTSGLTIVLDWVGATVSALFSGSLSGLLPLVAVPVAITLLLVAIIVIKRSIWGA